MPTEKLILLTSAEAEFTPINVSSEPSNGPKSGLDVATLNAVAAPIPFTAVTVMRISQPLVSAPTAGHSGKLIECECGEGRESQKAACRNKRLILNVLCQVQRRPPANELIRIRAFC